MTPPRDVEEEIYAQLYGEPSEPEDPAATRVIDGDHRTRPVREEPEPEPPRPGVLEALGLAAAAGARSVKEVLGSARVQDLRDAVRSTGSRRLRDAAGSDRARSLLDAVRSDWARAADGLGGRQRLLVAGALAVALVSLVLIAGLSSGSGDERQRLAGPPPGAASQLAAEAAAREAHEAREARVAREARQARRRRAQRRRAAAERRREESAVASTYQAPVEDSSPPNLAQPTDEGCSEADGCASQSSSAPQPPGDDDDAEQKPDRDTVERPRVRTSYRYGRIRGGHRYVRDVDVDVREVD